MRRRAMPMAGLVGAVVVGVVLIGTVLAPLLTPYDPGALGNVWHCPALNIIVNKTVATTALEDRTLHLNT